MKTLNTVRLTHPFLKGFSPEHQELSVEGAEGKSLEPGETVFQQGAPANRMYLLTRGKIRLECCRSGHSPVPVQTIGAGEVFGWSWLFPPFVWNLRAVALEESEVIALNGAHLLVSSEESPDFGFELLKKVAQVVVSRVQATRRQLLEKGVVLPATAASSPFELPLPAINVNLEQALAMHPFLRGLSQAHLKVLASCAMPVDFPPGQLVFREMDIANRLYLLFRGRVDIETKRADGSSIPIQSLGTGDVLGWSWLYPPFLWNFNARAVEHTYGIFLYGSRLREYIEDDHKLGCELLKRMTHVLIHRLRAAREQLLSAK